MEEKKRIHKIIHEGRNKGFVSGVYKVISFDEEEATLLLECEELIIKGKELHITKLDVDKGEIEFTGQLDNVTYRSKKNANQVADGIIKRLFR